MWKWFLLSLCFFCGLNWFILPTFPILRQWIPALSIYGAIGLSGLFLATSLILRDK